MFKISFIAFQPDHHILPIFNKSNVRFNSVNVNKDDFLALIEKYVIFLRYKNLI